ncbi:MAG: DUF4836 family protein [Bacteroidetes bacterium]|nr:MAG: DUF4836 family protein [Bacteroidota bacterium]TAG88432.1 MAG: DUF4836 family protein [Bacteroidota bacterium]
MFQTRKYLLIIFVAIFLFANACGSKKIEPTYIPNDVSGVICIDLKSMSNKATDFSNAIKVMSGDKYSFINQAFNAGLDYQKQAYIFVYSSPELSQNYTAGYMPLTSAKTFETALKKSIQENKMNNEMKKKDGWHYFSHENQAILMWNEKQVFFLVKGDKSDEEKLFVEAQKILKTPQTESLEAKQTSFKNLIGQNFDAAYWINPNFSTKNIPYLSNIEGLEMLLGIPKLIDEQFGTMSFEKGEILTKNTIKFNTENFKKFKNLIKPSYNQDLAKNIPLSDPIFVASFGLDMRGLEKTLDELKFLEKLKIQVSLLDMKIEDFFTMLSGDVVISGQTYGAKDFQDNDFLIGLGLEKKELFDKFIDDISSVGLIKKKKGYYVINYDDYRFFLIEKDKSLFLTLSPELRDKIIKENAKISEKLANSIGNQSLLFALDYNKLNKFIPWDSLQTNHSSKSIYQNIFKELDTFEVQAEPWGNEIQKTNIRLKLTNKSRNSISIMAEILEKIAKEMKETKPNT